MRLLCSLSVVLAVAAPIALSLSGPAGAAGVQLSPAVSVAGAIELYSLVVPRRESPTTSVSLTVPRGFSLSSFVPVAGWHRRLAFTAGRGGLVERVIWSGGPSPPDEDALFQFLAQPVAPGTYAFDVAQRLASGATVDWDGPARSAAAPKIEVVGVLGPSGRQPLIALVAFAVAAVGLIVAGTALLRRGHRGTG